MGGTIAGTATGLVPGIHVNTLAAIAVAVGVAGPGPAVAAVALAIAHTVVGILPATYLGVPDEDAPASVLPAHRMLHEGHAREAVRLSLACSLAAAIVAVLLLLPYRHVLHARGILHGLDVATPWILAAVLGWLLARAWRRGIRVGAWSTAVVGAAAALGLVSARISMSALVPVPATPLLPLLAGLFGIAGLLMAIGHARPPPAQGPPPAIAVPLPRVAAGLAAACWTAVLPGVTSATATAAAAPRQEDGEQDPRPIIATLSTVDTAHAVLALGVLWALSRPRTGLALAVQGWVPVQQWTAGPPPPTLAWVLAAALLGALGAAVLGAWLEPHFGRTATRLPPRALAITMALLLLTVTVILSGWAGLVVLAAATLVGLVPLVTGTPRIHLTACLLVPALWWSLA